MIVGILACVTAALALGSVFAPIKRFPSSDELTKTFLKTIFGILGFMVQFFMGLGGFLTSLVVHAILGFPPVYGLAMLGGSVWCLANAFAILIMNRLGLAVPILIWSTVSCLTGWATSRYGLFGVPKGIPSSVILNYIGVVVLVVGSSFFLFIKTKVYKPKMAEKLAAGVEIPSEKSNRPDLYPGAPKEGLPYLFSFFLGIMPTSTLVLAVYSGVKKNNPSLPSYLVLPSLLAGVLFAFGMGGFFIGNEKLSQTISYPICSFAPGLIVSAWSVLYFKEITGKRNLILLGIAYAFTLIGVIMVTVSKDL
ncbi:Protein CBG12716 [Caenorhabditis briggsae]|uniref:Protein CBG12716 n=1 Tax=Caenorhabditis briggsae TaxID=6238 RepID=A8XGE7_CAEBR|nr:Protein CBG12716 [Caenorhabditis briggsae]CAP31653.2 Protein CBG12716 [Caenorhabditis briggsae]